MHATGRIPKRHHIFTKIYARSNNMKLISSLPSIFLLFCLSIFSIQVAADNDPINNQATININTASVDSISKTLKGIGLKKAQAIVDYRENYGDFSHIEELTAVKGIGKSTLAKNAHLISLE